MNILMMKTIMKIFFENNYEDFFLTNKCYARDELNQRIQLTKTNKHKGLGLGLGTHLFVKVHRPGDSEVIFSVFESSCHLLLPV